MFLIVFVFVIIIIFKKICRMSHTRIDLFDRLLRHMQSINQKEIFRVKKNRPWVLSPNVPDGLAHHPSGFPSIGVCMNQERWWWQVTNLLMGFKMNMEGVKKKRFYLFFFLSLSHSLDFFPFIFNGNVQLNIRLCFIIIIIIININFFKNIIIIMYPRAVVESLCCDNKQTSSFS